MVQAVRGYSVVSSLFGSLVIPVGMTTWHAAKRLSKNFCVHLLPIAKLCTTVWSKEVTRNVDQIQRPLPVQLVISVTFDIAE
jgi:hypothetical protein